MKSHFLVAFYAGAISCVLSSALAASTYDIGDMNITGGSLSIWYADGGPWPQVNGNLFVFDTFASDTNLVGGYIGATGNYSDAVASLAVSSIGSVHAFTAPFNPAFGSTPAGTIAGGPLPRGSLNDSANTIVMDLSSWFYGWGELFANAGTGKADGVTSTAASGTWDPVTGVYELSWDSMLEDYACGPVGTGCWTHWTLEGVATAAVPLPAAAWLFGSGLLDLIGIARSKKA